MEKHHVVMGFGGVLVIAGLILGRTYYVYPGDMGRTITELIPEMSLLVLGAVLLLVGVRMEDGK